MTEVRVTWKQKFQRAGYLTNRRVEDFLESCGRVIATRPIWFLVSSLIFIILSCLCLLMAKTESRPEKLWSPPGTESVEQKAYYDVTFGPFYRINQIIVTNKNTGEDVITKEGLLEMYYLLLEVDALTVNVDGKLYGLNDVCATTYYGSPCIRQTPMDFWYNVNQKDWNIALLNSSTSAQLHHQISLPAESPLGNSVAPNTVLGIVKYGQNGDISYVGALLNTYLGNNWPNNLTVAETWERALLDLCANYGQTTKYINVYYSAEVSLQDELNKLIKADTTLLVISYVVEIVFVAISIGRLHPVRSKLLVGLSGITLVLASIASGLGLSALFQIVFSPISVQVLPFLLLGSGVDDMFIIANSFETLLEKRNAQLRKKNEDGQIEKDDKWIIDLMASAVRHGGPHCMLTSLTDFVAFMIGASGKMPAMRSFCFSAAIAIIIELLIQFTCFVPILVLDAKRVNAKRVDCIPCVTYTKIEEEEEGKEGIDKQKKQGRFNIPKSRIIHHFVEKYYAPFLLNPKVKVAVVIIFMSVLGVSIYGITQTQEGLLLDAVIPNGSYLVPFTNARNYYFGGLGAPTYWVMKDLDYTSHDIQSKMDAMISKIKGTPAWFDSPPFISWWVDFKNYVLLFLPQYIDPNTDLINPDGFYPALDYFLTVDTLIGPFYRDDVIVERNASNDITKIVASRFMCYSIGLNTTLQYVGSMTTGREITGNSGLGAFFYSVYTIYFEQYFILKDETLRNLGVALIGVLLVTLICFGLSFSAAFLSLIVIMIVILETLGYSSLWQIAFNPLSAVNLIMAIGLSVEFVSHFVRAFLKAEARTLDERVAICLNDMAPNVLSGFIATLLSVLVLGGASYPVLITYYFQMYLLITLLGVGNGVIFLPVLLSFFGPEPFIKGATKEEIERDHRREWGETENNMLENSNGEETNLPRIESGNGNNNNNNNNSNINNSNNGNSNNNDEIIVDSQPEID